MRLEKLKDNIVIVHETGRKDNGIEYDSRNVLSQYSKWRLSYVEDFLRENGEVKEANKIKKHLGKIIKLHHIPKIIATGSYKINLPLANLKDKIYQYVTLDGLDLNPDFQRTHVWSLEQRVKFVEFILQGGKTNPIYFNHNNWMKHTPKEDCFVIVDGKQRLTSLLMFLNNEFKVFKNLDKDGEGFYYSDFDTVGMLDIEIIINDLSTRKQVLEWYLQMNKRNIAHTKEELDRVETLLNKEH